MEFLINDPVWCELKLCVCRKSFCDGIKFRTFILVFNFLLKNRSLTFPL